jgi:hypothetical protein
MGSRHVWASGCLLLSAIAWGVALFVESGPWDSAAAGVMAVGLVVTVTVAVAAVMLESSRVGYWLGGSVLPVMLVIAALRPADGPWVAAVSLTAISAVLMADRRLGGWIRLEGPVAPIPRRATTLGLVLLAAPVATALSLLHQAGGPLGWLSLACWAALLIFVRRLPGALAVLRLGTPILALGAALLEFPGAAVWGLLMVVATALAWSKEVRLAVRPLIERGSRVSIPPELLSDDMRRAAGIERDPG